MIETSPEAQHDHSHCINEALVNARKICSSRGTRLTALRERVLELVWQSHKPVGAYEILANLKQEGAKPAQPPTVYRALGFLMDQGLVHRLPSTNSYIGCHFPEKKHDGSFLICTQCQKTIELEMADIKHALFDYAKNYNFSINSTNIELSGLCLNCQNGNTE